MKLIGITGLIGSGKSYICKMFERKGIPVFYCDDEAKSLYEEYEDLRNEVFALFDCNTDGKVDTKKLGKIVFQDKEKLNTLNCLIKEYFSDKFEKWTTRMREEEYSFVLVENAIMFQSDFYKRFDHIIGVILEKERRIKQVIERDNCTREDVLNRMDKQISLDELIEKSDHVFYSGNDDDMLNDRVDFYIDYFNKESLK